MSCSPVEGFPEGLALRSLEIREEPDDESHRHVPAVLGTVQRRIPAPSEKPAKESLPPF
jgi:hypothetical protein